MRSKSQKSSPRNIKLVLEYDGSRFFGFQRQSSKPTIQGELEKALSKLLGRSTKISAAAGRTDSGVHAKGQVVNFKTTSPLQATQIKRALNTFLPKEIVVKEASEVPLKFHARYDAKWKTYEYLVHHSETRSPLLDGHVYHFRYPLNLAKMKRAAKELVGRYHFGAFKASGSSAKTSTRHIRNLIIKEEGEIISFLVEADGFLYHMVRNMVGTLLDVGRGKLSVADFSKVFRGEKRSLAGPTAPPQGLTLVSVKY